jgi:hypothetical protein
MLTGALFAGRRAEERMMKSATALAHDGWEMVGAGFAYCHYLRDIEAIHFRRR